MGVSGNRLRVCALVKNRQPYGRLNRHALLLVRNLLQIFKKNKISISFISLDFFTVLAIFIYERK